MCTLLISLFVCCIFFPHTERRQRGLYFTSESNTSEKMISLLFSSATGKAEVRWTEQKLQMQLASSMMFWENVWTLVTFTQENKILALGSRMKCWDSDRPIWEREQTLQYQMKIGFTLIFGEDSAPASSYARSMQREMNQKTGQNYYLTAVL